MAGLTDILCGLVAGTILACDPPKPPPAPPARLDDRLYNVKPIERPEPRPVSPGKLSAAERIVFGRVKVGDPTARQRVSLANVGGSDLNLTTVELAGSDSFTLEGGCGALRPGKTCVVTVGFRPMSAGLKDGALLIGVAGTFQRIALEGEGVSPPPPPPPKPVVQAPPQPPAAPKGPSPSDRARLMAAMQTMNTVMGRPVDVAPGPAAELNPGSPLGSLGEQAEEKRLREAAYPGARVTGKFDGLVSTLPLQRCRIIQSVKPIPVVLDTTIKSQIGGKFIGHVAQDVYGEDGRLVLLPGGSDIEGEYKPLGKQGDDRLQASVVRVIRPDGASIDVRTTQTFDLAGSVGVVGEVDNRLLERFGTVVGATGISALVAIASSSGGGTATGTSELEAAGDAINQNLAQVAADALRNGVNLAPRVTVDKGTLLTVYPAKDWYFPNPTTIQELNEKDRNLSYDCTEPLFTPSRGIRQNRKG
tara:strand:+ start:1275 stop:2699 length:1425 start_codon:yes stop_codon:yes gene_type:complete